VPRATRFFQAITAACPTLKLTNGDIEQAARLFLRPSAAGNGLSVDLEEHRALLVLLADPTTTICP